MNEADKFVNSKIDEFADKFSTLKHISPPKTLFHYTDSETLLKIIENKCIWMTHALYTNDSSEFIHGMIKFKSALDILEDKGVEKSWLDRIREFFDQEMKSPLAEPYVFSLTERSDQLSQWRGYGDNCNGLSIGFNTEVFNADAGIHFKCVSVIYDPSIQNQIVNSVIQGFINLILSLGHKIDDGKKWGPSLARGYFQVAYAQSIRFKDPSWCEEREWRNIKLTPPQDANIFLRKGSSSLKKTYNLNLADVENLITVVNIGPLSDKEKQIKALEFLKLNSNLKFDITMSMIPMKN
jgi:hypothetical protein